MAIKCTACNGTGEDGVGQMRICPRCQGAKYTRMGYPHFGQHDNKTQICSGCDGRGTVLILSSGGIPCRVCYGKGYIDEI